MTTQKQQMFDQTVPMPRPQNSSSINHIDSAFLNEDIDEEMTRSALIAFRVKEEEIEKRKNAVREKIEAHLGRVEEETKRLAEIREDLEALTDPMRKEVAIIRKRIDLINRELKPLGLSCQKKEKEYKEAIEAFNDKNREKSQLIGKLVELVTESEKLRLNKLEKLSNNINSLC
ncbi:uncharacterized protein [Primulina huaijiensis]|uniref:uncharacterized protein n=1 Tax=Primulina huaijiensis TaxID=1492673 RepID=UPI003CC6E154